MISTGIPETRTIWPFRDPRLPQFAFEWHSITKKVYRIDIPGEWVDSEFVPSASGIAKGFCIAEHVDTHGAAHGFVQTFCRGYLKAFNDWHKKKMDSNAPERIKETDSCPIR